MSAAPKEKFSAMKKNTKAKEEQTVKEEAAKDEAVKEEKSGKILDSLAGSVDEVEEELEREESDDESEAVFDPAAPMMKNRKTFFIVGIIIILLSIVGLVTTVRFSVNTVKDILNQTSLKNDFAQFLNPMTIIDSPAFDSTENIPPSVVISASIWRILLSGNTNKYESNESTMTISEIDVESAAVALFGYNVTVEHQTVTAGSSYFEYNSSSKSYNVPVNADNNTYWPQISEISSVGDTFTVVVQYMPPIMGVGETAMPEPAKSMIYTVSRTASSMTLKSIQYPEDREGRD